MTSTDQKKSSKGAFILLQEKWQDEYIFPLNIRIRQFDLICKESVAVMKESLGGIMKLSIVRNSLDWLEIFVVINLMN